MQQQQQTTTTGIMDEALWRNSTVWTHHLRGTSNRDKHCVNNNHHENQ